MKLPHAPPFEASDLDVEVTLERIVDEHQQAQMRPRQFFTQCVKNLFVRETLRLAETAPQLLLSPAFAILASQQCRQR